MFSAPEKIVSGSCSKQDHESCEATETVSRYAQEENMKSSSRADVVTIGGELKERACDSLVMCIVTTLNQGLRNGGGIGDILRAPSSTVSIFFKYLNLKVLSGCKFPFYFRLL